MRRHRRSFSPIARFVASGALALSSAACTLQLPSTTSGTEGEGGATTATTGTSQTGQGGGATTTSSTGSLTSVTVGVTATVGVGVGAGPSSSTASGSQGTGGGGEGVGGAEGVGGGGGAITTTGVTTTGVTTTGVGGGAVTTTGVGGGGVTTTGVGGAGPGTGGAGTVTTGVGSTSSSVTSTTATTGVTTGTSSASSGTSTSSSTGGGGLANDACPGEVHAIDIDERLTIGGSTTGAGADISVSSDSCFNGADTSGADVIYAIDAGATGTLTASLAADGAFAGVLYVETACGDESTLLSCGPIPANGAVAASFAVTQGDTLYFVVDGAAGVTGDFNLNISLAPPTCGDGIVNGATEACDDGNTADGDGCSSTCTVEAPQDHSDTCPGETMPIAMSQVIDIEGPMGPPLGEATTSNYHDDYLTCDGIIDGSPSGSGPDQGGNDRVFQIVPATSGILSVQLRNMGASGGGFDGTLAVWANACTPGPASADFDWSTGLDAPNGDYMGCSDHAYGTDPWDASSPDDPLTQESLTFSVTAGTPYFVVVDGYSGTSAGEFWLHVALNPAE